MAALILLGTTYIPVAQANHNGNGSNTSATAQQTPVTTTSGSSETSKTPPKTKEVIVKPREKSLFDTEVLDSPITYLKNAFASDEEESDTATSNSAVVITVKALIATLLSTIM